MNNKILIAAALVMSAGLLTACNNTEHNATHSSDSSMNKMEHNETTDGNHMDMDNDMMKAMNSSMGSMNTMKMSGDFDLDFANMMITHHQGAIDMSNVEISKGTDAQIKAMAQNIITSQKAEIEQLQLLVKNYKMPEAKTPTSEKHDELMTAMNAMMNKMKGIQMTGNTDKDFVMMMIPHHESAVEMAGQQLSHGKNLELKKMAQKMIEDQSKEIKEFTAWLDKQK